MQDELQLNALTALQDALLALEVYSPLWGFLVCVIFLFGWLFFSSFSLHGDPKKAKVIS